MMSSKEILVYLSYEEIHWLRYLILASIEDYKDDPEKKALYLQILNKFSASETEDITVKPKNN
jgi:hypothetical protein